MNTGSFPSQRDLLIWLSSAGEYQFTERKSKTDKGGWLRTIIAFANSNPFDTFGVLYIGVNDGGGLEGMTQAELESAMKSLGTRAADQCWPPIPIVPVIVKKDSAECLAIVVPYSSQRPHFAGRAYVRRGTETIEASEGQYEELIATRNAKTREILKWLEKEITFITRTSTGHAYTEQTSTFRVILKTCTALFVTLDFVQAMGNPPKIKSYALHAIEVSFDNRKGRLTLIRYADR